MMQSTRQLPLFNTGVTSHTPLAQAISPFQKYLRDEGKTSNTIIGFTSDLHLLCEYFGEEAPVGRISTSHLNKFLDWMEHGRGKPCSRKSYARRVTTIKVFFKWLENLHARSDNPAAAILQRSGPAPLQSVLSLQDIHTLQAYCQDLRAARKPDSRAALLLNLLLLTGIKKSECMNLTLQHVDRRDVDHLLLIIKHKKKRDVYRERRIPLNREWLDMLDEYVEQYHIKDVIFPCTARNLEYVLSDAGKAAGIEGRASFEILRWTCAVRDYLNGMDVDSLREKMGLSRISWRETGQKIALLAQGRV